MSTGSRRENSLFVNFYKRFYFDRQIIYYNSCKISSALPSDALMKLPPL